MLPFRRRRVDGVADERLKIARLIARRRLGRASDLLTRRTRLFPIRLV